jgi:hypothetical protein
MLFSLASHRQQAIDYTLVASQYNQKKAELARILKERAVPEADSLWQFGLRLCAPPFPRGDGTMALWLSLWPILSPAGRQRALELPNPCLNHIESRYRKLERAQYLDSGLSWILKHDEDLFIEGLRLYPHALCRTAETIGPLTEPTADRLAERITGHRLWGVKKSLTEDEFWEATERLVDFRDLPQPLLDYLDLDRAKEEAPIEEFQESLQRFLLRRRIEKIRTTTYELLRVHSHPKAVEIGI